MSTSGGKGSAAAGAAVGAAAPRGIEGRLGVLPTMYQGMNRQPGTYIFVRGQVSTGARPEGEPEYRNKEVAVFRHKDDEREFEVLPNPESLTDREKARAQVGNRYKKIKERAAAAGNAAALQQNAIAAAAQQQQSAFQQQADAHYQAGIASFAKMRSCQQQAQVAGGAVASATDAQQDILVQQREDLASPQDGEDDEPPKKKMRRARKSDYPTATPRPPDAPSAVLAASSAAAAQGKDGQAKPKAPASAALSSQPATVGVSRQQQAGLTRSKARGILGIRGGTAPTSSEVDRAFRKAALKRNADLSLLQKARALLNGRS